MSFTSLYQDVRAAVDWIHMAVSVIYSCLYVVIEIFNENHLILIY